MGRVSRGSGHPTFRRHTDLTGLISLAERNDLTTLVSAITDKMHNDISCIFDSPPVTPVLDHHDHHHWLSLALFKCAIVESDAKSSPQISGDGSKAFAKAHKIVVKEEAEAMTPQLRELKKEALLFFRKWQTALLQRTREIHITDPTAPQGNPRPRGARGRGVRPGVRPGIGRGGLTLATGPPRAPSTVMDEELAKRFSPIPNTLWLLSVDKRRLLLHLVILLVLSLQDFGANARILLLNLTSSLNLSLELYHTDELRVSHALAKAALDFAASQQFYERPNDKTTSRRWKAGLAAASPPNAGLAGRLRSDGIGDMQHGPGLGPAAVAGLLGSMAEHGHLLSNLFGISPVRPLSKMVDNCCRDIQDFALIRLHDDAHSEYRVASEMPAVDRRLRVTLAMNGCLSQDKDVTTQWKCLGRDAETYVVQWEVDALVQLGGALETVIKSTAWRSAKKEIAARTSRAPLTKTYAASLMLNPEPVFSSLMDFCWPSHLLKVSKLIDIPWSTGIVRAEKAGALLADAIVRHKFQGERSVSLIGYSLGSRAIYTCLMVLAERRQFGLIDSVVMMGTPAPSESRVWLTLKSVVSGRLVNVYSEQDFLLGFMYRTSNVHFGVAGLQEVQGAYGVENHCVGELPRGHVDYHSFAGRILQDIGWEGVAPRPQPPSSSQQEPKQQPTTTKKKKKSAKQTRSQKQPVARRNKPIG
ncbi:hypothetical protein L249_2414 [Ophiocordyceps polyrhachis-furcata BCC 54312]|uniref:DUF726 domain-containing protein n=1 Tax=Ophiocordyceps polyrhachis-furcata BCC 54312 TaxID=1330021 RepID=A0A367LPY4_9HYPO|nr:hypothetical protein L249_2414 [Ophiocordyceps polyrhachis-furcata BCC 54312]